MPPRCGSRGAAVAVARVAALLSRSHVELGHAVAQTGLLQQFIYRLTEDWTASSKQDQRREDQVSPLDRCPEVLEASKRSKAEKPA